MMRYLSICSGIEAATVALEPFGFAPALYSEIEPFPRAVLKDRNGAYNLAKSARDRVPLWGDFTALRVRHFRRFGIPLPEVLIGGTPCQAFSIAGARLGLADERGNLSLQFIKLAHALRNAGSLRLAWWENVPGVLSMPDNAFGCFLGGLVGADAPLRSPRKRGRWPSAGMVAGPVARAAWRVFDAQYFGLAQRRARVFVVAGFGDGIDPAEILFERKGLQRHPAPRRPQGQGVTHDLAPCLGASGRGFERAGDTRGQDAVVAHTLNAKGGQGRLDGESETFVAHALRGEGFDASEDGTGRGTLIVPIAFDCKAGANTGFSIGETPGTLRGDGHGGGHIAIAFSCKDSGDDASLDLAPTLRSMNFDKSHANAGGQLAVAVSLRGREGGATAELGGDVMPALRTGGGGGDKPHALGSFGVRRLMPTECEALQGFPRGYTAIPWRGKPAGECPDGPRYKALGNSMAVPVMAWIGRRIAAMNGRKEQ
jgi:DNA (cytosine-5)-methyltransferase 1